MGVFLFLLLSSLFFKFAEGQTCGWHDRQLPCSSFISTLAESSTAAMDGRSSRAFQVSTAWISLLVFTTAKFSSNIYPSSSPLQVAGGSVGSKMEVTVAERLVWWSLQMRFYVEVYFLEILFLLL